jgi:hypothetical protein
MSSGRPPRLEAALPATIAALLLVLEPRYEARTMTFGCNSTAEVVELQRIRSDPRAFQKLLFTQMAYGQCIAIGKGAVVEGSVEAGDRSILRIEARTSPPGYMAPAEDFAPVDGRGR